MTQPRISYNTVTFIDNNCSAYQKLFPEVRNYEAFKRLHLGIAAEIITKLQEIGLKFELVLADSLYGESDTFLSVLNQYKTPFIVAIRSNHAVWMPAKERLRFNKGKEFKRIFTNGTREERYMREIIFGRRRNWRYWQITTDITKLPENFT